MVRRKGRGAEGILDGGVIGAGGFAVIIWRGAKSRIGSGNSWSESDSEESAESEAAWSVACGDSGCEANEL